MPRILAVEADSTRKTLLAALVRERVPAALTIVNSVQEAVASMAASAPDVVLVPTLLSPQDEQHLMAGIKSLDAPYVQTLTIPALALLAAPPQERPRRFHLRRRRTPRAESCGRGFV